MVHQQLLARGNVKLVLHQVVDDLPRQVDLALQRRQRRDAPAFVRVVVLGCRADRKCRHLVEKEIQAVVVVKNDHHVRLDLAQPLVHWCKAIEKWLPVWLLLQAFVNSATDCRNVGSAQTTNNFCHVMLL